MWRVCVSLEFNDVFLNKMLQRTWIYLFFQTFVCVYGDKHATVGLLENAPKYGTYPHKTSDDIYMDPCKACKYPFFDNWDAVNVRNVQYLPKIVEYRNILQYLQNMP